MTAREEILARIAAALGPDPAPVAVPRRYRRSAEPADLVGLFAARLVDYKAMVVPLPAGSVAATVLSHVDGRVLVPDGLPWTIEGADVDAGFTAAELDRYGTVVTACAAACAETGTIVLDAGPDQGRRAISLLPDRHICVVRADQVVPTIPELLARLDPGRPLTFISGPSATSDIELQRVEGVHGPRTLIVLLVS
jgi:L-lactate dehydrogenase complex protein LldG